MRQGPYPVRAYLAYLRLAPRKSPSRNQSPEDRSPPYRLLVKIYCHSSEFRIPPSTIDINRPSLSRPNYKRPKYTSDSRFGGVRSKSIANPFPSHFDVLLPHNRPRIKPEENSFALTIHKAEDILSPIQVKDLSICIVAHQDLILIP